MTTKLALASLLAMAATAPALAHGDGTAHLHGSEVALWAAAFALAAAAVAATIWFRK